MIYIVFFGPVKPELGVIPSGQEIIHEWIFKFSIPSHSSVSILVFLSKRSEEVLLFFFVILEISKMRNRMEINL